MAEVGEVIERLRGNQDKPLSGVDRLRLYAEEPDDWHLDFEDAASAVEAIDEAAEALSALLARAESAEARCDELREALRPFAAIQALLDDARLGNGDTWSSVLAEHLTVGDFRRAARALADKVER
jgi:hypothetical protein